MQKTKMAESLVAVTHTHIHTHIQVYLENKIIKLNDIKETRLNL